MDGFNLYYSGRRWFGRDVAGWRWLSPKSLAAALVAQRANWSGARVNRVVYCTARIDAAEAPVAYVDQDVYLKALDAEGAVDHIEFGQYVARTKQVPLACQPRKGRPQLVRPPAQMPEVDLPLMVANDANGDRIILATALVREEKGSDVNVATHMLVDVLSREVDAVVVVSNDSDLGLPLKIVRNYVPVGVVNPSTGFLAGALQGKATDGVGRHWWRQLSRSDFTDHQMPDPAGSFTRPPGW
ncbi:NYN domain-containing protein [Amycolatopsis suaedae]|uniref:NYN domain-containing protein n=1 Tax=Amycolatopsis suaedae TaxID=2510978 RepID=UPI001F0ED77D|nr:NYN domain-containing protein [Amycolatopsis suaedae]